MNAKEPPNETYRDWIDRALHHGDLEALESIVASVQERVYNLAVKFLWHPEDAEDAAQEILLKIVLHLNQFEFQSAFSTWAHRIAVNYLIDAKKTRRTRFERAGVSFEDIAGELRAGSEDPALLALEDGEELNDLAENVKAACTHAMLACLDREGRMAFLLGEVFAMKGPEAAQVLGISADAYRQRLARARSRLAAFLDDHCGLMNAGNACRCDRRISYAKQQRGYEPYLRYAAQLGRAVPPGEGVALLQQQSDDRLMLSEAALEESERIERLAVIFRTNRRLRAPERLLAKIKGVFANLKTL